jgi:hypothetical protein
MRVGLTTSKDRPGEGAVAVYLEQGLKEGAQPVIPAAIGGVATVVVPAAAISAPESSLATPAQPHPASLALALAAKQHHAAELLKSNPAVFGVGVGQSLDNPADAAVILYLDRRKFSGRLPESLNGQRVRAVVMDRVHVTRSHGTPAPSGSTCSLARRTAAAGDDGSRTAEPGVGGNPGLPEIPILLPE